MTLKSIEQALIVLFVFFLPLRSVEIPGVFVGFSINPARLFGVFIVLVIFISSCLDGKYFKKMFFSDTYGNPYLNLFLFYIILSILFYYTTLLLGKTVLFGGQDFFFRNWKGRSIGQFVSLITYGVVPYFVIKRYSQNRSFRKILKRTIIIVTIGLVYYGYLQQLFYYLGLPVTGRDLFESIIPVETISGKSYLRFYSLGGEPRNLGGFLIGAIMFYLYYNYGKNKFIHKANVVLIMGAFLLTFSTTAFIICLFSFTMIAIDLIFSEKPLFAFRGLLIFLLVLFSLFATGTISFFGDKAIRYFEAYSNFMTSADDMIPAPVLYQSAYTSIIYYLADITKIDLYNLFFGFGYGNFSSGVYDILKTRFGWDLLQEPHIIDAGFYLYRVLIELGLIGTLIFIMIFVYTLKLSKKLLRFYKKTNNRYEYRKTLFLRYSFIVFFVSNAMSISFYYFIIMGLLIGKANHVLKETKEKIA